MNSFYFQCAAESQSSLQLSLGSSRKAFVSVRRPQEPLQGRLHLSIHKNQTRSKYFVFLFSENHLFVAYFASTCKVFFFKDQSDVYHKELPRVHQKQNLALSLSLDLNQLVLQAQNTSVGATLRKTLRCFDTLFSETIPIFFIRLSANILNVLHSKDAIKFKLKCASHECMAVRINLEKLA